VGVDYFVWCVVEVFVFYGYVDDSGSGSFYHGRTTADSLVCCNVGMSQLGLLQRLDLLC